MDIFVRDFSIYPQRYELLIDAWSGRGVAAAAAAAAAAARQ